MDIFNDNPLMNMINKVINCLYLSVLWLIFSLPLFTLGASTTALYYTANKVIRHDKGYVFQQFWHCFKSSFKKSTILWLLFIFAIFLFYTNSKLIMMQTEGNLFGTMMQTFFRVFIVLWCCQIIYVLAYIARFEAPIKDILKNTTFMAIRHLPRTILMFFICVMSILLSWLIPVAIMFIPAVSAYIVSANMEKIFECYIEQETFETEVEGKVS